MKETLYILIIFMIFFTSCGNKNSTQEYEMKTAIPMSEFIIGKWECSFQTTDIHGSYTKEYQVEFKKSGRISYVLRSPYNSYDTNFKYKFDNADAIWVENRRYKGGQWTLHKSGENLEICFWEKDDCNLFTRVSE